MPKVICTDCQVEYKIEKNGVYVVEMFSDPPQPYKLWSADLWKCPNCRREIIAGFGMSALAEHFQKNFTTVLDQAKKTGKVFYDYEYKE